MTKIHEPTDLDIRLHALNLAVNQRGDVFRATGTDIAAETLATARRYADWITNGGGEDPDYPLCAVCGTSIKPSDPRQIFGSGLVCEGCSKTEIKD